MIAVNWPRAMSTSTWSSATTRVSPAPYAFTTCRARAATAVRPPVPPCLGMVTAVVTVCLLCGSIAGDLDRGAMGSGAGRYVRALRLESGRGGGCRTLVRGPRLQGEIPTPRVRPAAPRRHKARLRTGRAALVLRGDEPSPSPRTEIPLGVLHRRVEPFSGSSPPRTRLSLHPYAASGSNQHVVQDIPTDQFGQKAALQVTGE